jgi:hypothetical protein
MKTSTRIGGVLHSPGQVLDAPTRSFFEPRLAQHFRRRRFHSGGDYRAAEGEANSAARAVLQSTPDDLGPRYNFGRVRVHADRTAAESARALRASAYTIGHHIVLDPAKISRHLVGHELTHVLQQGASGRAALQCQSTEDKIKAPEVPRKDYIFIMGEEPKGSSNPYYAAATRFYKAHEPTAIMVTDIRNLTDLLSYVATNISAPVGNLIVVTHANEDGTVGFGLNAEDKDKRLTVQELRAALHPVDGSATKLANVAKRIDAKTRIHLKGCDVGRTQGMVELFDEAFGGADTVIATTHEQEYGYDPTLAQAEEKRVREEKLTEYTATLEPIPEAPGAIDKSLKGADLKAAIQERNTAISERQKALKERARLIKLKKTEIEVEAKAAGELAGTYESFGGAMFQRPGTNKETDAELKPEVAKTYGQLDEKQQAALVGRLIKAEKVIAVRPAFQEYTDPRTLAEANIALAVQFREQHFVGTKVLPSAVDGLDLTIMVEGVFSLPGEKARKDIFATAAEMPDESDVLSEGRKASPNPERYAWRAEHTHAATGKSKVTAVGERVMAYDHHGSLDPSAHEHFFRPGADKQYYATSTFAPTPPPPPQTTTGAAP